MALRQNHLSSAIEEYEAALRDFMSLNEESMSVAAAGRAPSPRLLQQEDDARLRLIAARRAAWDLWRE